MSVKDIIVKPIKSQIANEFVKKYHYSGKVAANSQLHFGCFLNGVLGGVMSFGPSLDKKKIVGAVKNTRFNDFLELNRMAFSDLLPRNSESRCISVALRLIKKHYPNIRWVISFADGTQCGDGTIYRASGFSLIGIKKNKTILEMPDGSMVADITLRLQSPKAKMKYATMMNLPLNKFLQVSDYKKAGAKEASGFMLKYIYFLDKSARADLTVPVLPFSKIQEVGAGMYKGKKKDLRVGLKESTNQCVNGGVIPTPTLHLNKGGANA